MLRLKKPLIRAGLLAFLAWFSFLSGAAEDLDFYLNDEKEEVDGRSHDGHEYYQIKDLAKILSLQLEEQRSSLKIIGPRGEIRLQQDRPLVRLGEQYVLLSAKVWRKSRGDWYVPEDFMTRVLPGVLTSRLERLPSGAYRVDILDRNRVQVEVVNYPNQVSIVLRPSLPAPVEIKDFQNYIEVDFQDSLVVPEIDQRRPRTDLVSSIQFDPSQNFGSFQIQKGENFATYRQYRLNDPTRIVIDFYGTRPSAPTPASLPDAVEVAADPPLPNPEDQESDSLAGPAIPADDAEAPPVMTRVEQGVIMIDPGHGGADYGVNLDPGVVEKQMALELARMVRRELRSAGPGVRMTRQRDVDLALEQRSSVANFYASKLYLGLHFGASPVSSTRGPVVYVYPQMAQSETESSTDSPGEEPLVTWQAGQQRFRSESRRLAQEIQNELNEIYGTENSVVEAPLRVLAPIMSPAVIVEAGFLSNEQDRQLLASQDFQVRVASGLARAVKRFLR